ncbi:glycosyltransferase family 4 protein [Halogeometricum borinquense]|uniref:Glycosyltransferase family 4 protein n=1 Tax=Halogeometricum borinquense TaxID=60847 RepID=A0A6C0UJ48_9EURY|nr:glycosyltransferase family 4 protein [Halogeometricum borinquense]QIB75512.1 glycosyltransferase family 4 protein [Halogeometricum borinquense]
MNPAFVSNVVYPFVTGGAEKRIHEIGTRLAARGHDVTIYGRHFWDGPKETTHEGVTLRAVAPGTDLYTDDRRSITEAIDFAARLAYPLSKQLRRNEHDLVVASVFPYFPVLSAKLAALGTETPIVSTWHEVWRDYWDDYLGTLAPFGKIVEHLTARTPQHPIAVSGITADRLTEIGPSRDDIEVVPNGIDVEQIRNAPLPEENGESGYDVLFAGRLIADKNVSVLIDAFDSVADEYDATLGIIGDGPEFDRLQRQAQRIDHADRVTFLGFLDAYEDVLGHMRAADVFASPSTREGFGITYAEAMAADCTVIGATHPESAASEVIGDAGYLAEPTVESVAESLARAFEGDTPPTDPLERATRFDWDTVAEQAESAYERAMRGSW